MPNWEQPEMFGGPAKRPENLNEFDTLRYDANDLLENLKTKLPVEEFEILEKKAIMVKGRAKVHYDTAIEKGDGLIQENEERKGKTPYKVMKNLSKGIRSDDITDALRELREFIDELNSL